MVALGPTAGRLKSDKESEADAPAAPASSFVDDFTADYTYTASGRLLTAALTGTDPERYTFDAAGNLTGDGTRTYVYDSNRLSQVKIGSQVQTYFFFDAGKRWRVDQAPTAVVNAQTGRSTDPNRITYAYSGTGRLSEYKKYSGGYVDVQGAYSYDASGQRKASTVTQGTGETQAQTTTHFTYTGLTLHKLEATKTQAGTSESWSLTYLYDEYGKPYAGIYRDTTPAQTPVVFAMVTTDRGDVVELLDASGQAFAAYRYDAWGNPLGQGNAGKGVWAQGTVDNENHEVISPEVATKIAQRQPLRYAGYCYDSESGLYYLSARHYDPATRQFLSKDLSRNDGEQSAYQYCLGNPVGLVDPSGMCSECPLWYESHGRQYKIPRNRPEMYKRWLMTKPIIYVPRQDEPLRDCTEGWRQSMIDNCGNIGHMGGGYEALLFGVLPRVQDTGEWDMNTCNAGPEDRDNLVANIQFGNRQPMDKHEGGNFYIGVLYSALRENARELALEASLIEAQKRAKGVMYTNIANGMDYMEANRQYYDDLDHEAGDQEIMQQGIDYGLQEIMPYVDYETPGYWVFP